MQTIEDFIFASTNSLKSVESFLEMHDNALRFIGENPLTAPTHFLSGDQSWPFAEGRYRIFFKTQIRLKKMEILLIDIIDNRSANLWIYPNNSIADYFED